MLKEDCIPCLQTGAPRRMKGLPLDLLFIQCHNQPGHPKPVISVGFSTISFSRWKHHEPRACRCLPQRVSGWRSCFILKWKPKWIIPVTSCLPKGRCLPHVQKKSNLYLEREPHTQLLQIYLACSTFRSGTAVDFCHQFSALSPHCICSWMENLVVQVSGKPSSLNNSSDPPPTASPSAGCCAPAA